MKKFTLALGALSILFISSCGPASKKSSPTSVGAAKADADAGNKQDSPNSSPADVFSPKDYDDVGDFVRVKNRDSENASGAQASEGSGNGSGSTSSSTNNSDPNPGANSGTANASLDVAHEYVVTGGKSYPLKRERLQLRSVKYNFDIQSKILSLQGDVIFNGENGRPFQMEGAVEKGLVNLVIKDSKSELKSIFKARATCFAKTEESDLECKEFYVDFYYLNGGVLYTDQLIPKAVVQNIQIDIQQNQSGKDQDSGFTNEPTEGAEVIVNQDEADDQESEAPIEESVDSDIQPGGYFSGNTSQDVADLFPQLVKPAAPAVKPGATTKPGSPAKPEAVKPSPVKPSSPQTGGGGKPAPVKPAPKPKPSVPVVAPEPVRPPVVVVPAKPQQGGNPDNPSLPITTGNEIINPNMFEVAGRPENQAVGRVDAGSIKKSTSLVDLFNKMGPSSALQIFGRVVNERKFFGTWDMVVLIQKMVQWVGQSLPGQFISVGNVAKQLGGKTAGGQISHQNGLDADIAYFRTEKKPSKMNYVVDFAKDKVLGDFLIEKQWALFKKIYASKAVDIIIVDPVVKIALCKKAVALGEFKTSQGKELATKVLNRLYSDQKFRYSRKNGRRVYTRNKMHANHFHLRIKCGGHHRQCYQYKIADQGLGCKIN